jgi:hypothetical protein
MLYIGMTTQTTKNERENKMLTKAEKIRINEIVCNLIVKNMKAGLAYKKAKTAAFNRMNKECPEVLTAWLNR